MDKILSARIQAILDSHDLYVNEDNERVELKVAPIEPEVEAKLDNAIAGICEGILDVYVSLPDQADSARVREAQRICQERLLEGGIGKAEASDHSRVPMPEPPKPPKGSTVHEYLLKDGSRVERRKTPHVGDIHPFLRDPED